MINHLNYLFMRFQELKEKTAGLPLYTLDNEIIFFFIVKNETIKNSLQRVLDNYEKKYEKLKKVKKTVLVSNPVPLQKTC